MKPAPRLKDIAAHAGLDVSTVSLALRGDPRIRPATAERVRAAARALGYRTDPVLAHLMTRLRLRRGERYRATLAFLCAAPREAYERWPTQRRILAGATRRAAELGYELAFFHYHRAGHGPARWDGLLRARGIEGVVLGGFYTEQELAAAAPVWRARAVVYAGLRRSAPALHVACNDHFATAALATRRLAELHYRHPALVIDPGVDALLERRFTAGFCSAHPQGEAAGARSLVRLPLPIDHAKLVEAIRRGRHDALLCLDPVDQAALEAAGWPVPARLGLASLDLPEPAGSLAGVWQNSDHTGMSAVDLVVAQLQRGERGVPPYQKCQQMEGAWHQGSTVRDRSQRVEPRTTRARRSA